MRATPKDLAVCAIALIFSNYQHLDFADFGCCGGVVYFPIAFLSVKISHQGDHF
ncbi:hypothetical protein [Fischerella thermalis]|uniref:hypothetical protein n=1 Tax=Fischerella thermalis TaxID=372787 RepID=UPI0015E06D43|nr:hypothetical protein [Fischerella thermalis]